MDSLQAFLLRQQTLSAKLDTLNALLDKKQAMANVPQPPPVICYYCRGNHYSAYCQVQYSTPQYQENHVHYLESFNGQQYDYTGQYLPRHCTSYDHGWSGQPNSAWGNDYFNLQVPQAQQKGFDQQEEESNLKDLMIQFMQESSATQNKQTLDIKAQGAQIQVQAIQLQNQGAQLQNLETQMENLVTMFNEELQDELPRTIEEQPRDQWKNIMFWSSGEDDTTLEEEELRREQVKEAESDFSLKLSMPFQEDAKLDQTGESTLEVLGGEVISQSINPLKYLKHNVQCFKIDAMYENAKLWRKKCIKRKEFTPKVKKIGARAKRKLIRRRHKSRWSGSIIVVKHNSHGLDGLLVDEKRKRIMDEKLVVLIKKGGSVNLDGNIFLFQPP